MLGNAVLAARAKKTPDHIRIVSVCPNSCLRNVLRQLVLRPENLLVSGAPAVVRAMAFCAGSRGSEEGSDMLQPTRGAHCMLMVFVATASPCFIRMSS